MRPRVPWINELDDLILEFFDELGEPAGAPVVMTPRSMYLNLVHLRDLSERSESTVSRRMQGLEEIGLLERVDGSAYYVLTEKGRAYLDGELSADDLVPPDDEA